MRVFKTSTKDSKTGYEMILSECSYNMACNWLQLVLEKSDYSISGTSPYSKGLIAIFTERTSIDTGDLEDDDMPIGMYSGRTYFYDEERGYLLGE